MTFSDIAANPDQWTDTYTKIQLAFAEGEEGLQGDSLRLSLEKNLLSWAESLPKSSGLSLFSSAAQIDIDLGQNKIAVIPGLKNFCAFRTDPGWLKVLAKLGLRFIWEQDPGLLFTGEDWNETGRKLLQFLDESGLLLIISNLDSGQAKTLLKHTSKPVVLIARELFDKEVLNLIRETHSALGLFWNEGKLPEFFERLAAIKDFLGSEHVIIINQDSILEADQKAGLLRIMARILTSGYPWSDILNFFSGTFLRVLGDAH
jgi:microsomal dipeptidase-like Zn-dependent dipeptidase